MSTYRWRHKTISLYSDSLGGREAAARGHYGGVADGVVALHAHHNGCPRRHVSGSRVVKKAGLFF